ncbi:MAG TPA: MFS transporter [Actinomycetota bacterium]|nr:MFS transporter [Actinomycetota bacterium]
MANRKKAASNPRRTASARPPTKTASSSPGRSEVNGTEERPRDSEELVSQIELSRSDELQALALSEQHVAVTGGVDEEIADAVPRRVLVPSDRQVAQGASRDVFKEITLDSEPKVPRGEAVRRWFKDADPRQIEGPKVPLVVLGLMFMLAQWDDQALIILLPEMRADFGLNLVFLSTLASVLGFFAIATAPFMGYVADRFKRVHLIRIGAFLSNFSSLALAFAQSVPHLVGSRVAAGVAGSVSGPAGFPLFTDYYPSRSRARVISFLFATGAVGGIIGTSIAGNLAEWLGWRGAVGVLAVVALVAAVGTFFLKEPVRGYWDRKEMGATEEVANEEQKPMTWGESWRAAYSISTLRRLSFATPFLHIGGEGVGLIMALYWAEVFHLTPRFRGYLATLGGVVGLLGLVYSAPIAEKLLRYKPGRIFTLVMTMTFYSVGAYVLLAFVPNLPLAIVIFLPVGFVGALILPAQITMITMVVPARMRGLGIQTTLVWRIPGLLFIPIIFGVTQDWGLQKSLLAFAPLILIGGLIVGSAAGGVDRDIRAARAASMADEEARRARASGKSKMIVCRDVDVEYDGVQVLFNVDFDVEEGELVALLGTNGAGKSTMLRAISGVQQASNGAIFLDGQDITHVPPYENAQNGIVMVPGGHAIFPTLTVEENLRTAAWMYREDEDYVKKGLEKVLDFFPILRERFNQQAGNLSGGEQQMVALGQSFLMKPRLLMIDELSLGLAPQIVEQLLNTLRAIHAEGTTVILVEQSLNVALTIAKRAVFMEKGEIRFDGSVEELMRKPELVRSVFMGGVAAGASGIITGASRRKMQFEDRERILSVEGVDVSFGGVQALRGAGCDVSAAEIVGIIGPNGAGKTTLFDAISGFITIDAGRVMLEATDITNLGPDGRARLGLGRSFQNVRLFSSMTVRENIAVARERHISARNPLTAALWTPATRRAEKRVTRRVDNLIDVLGLDAYADKFVNELSTGTRRAVDIACIMASEPRVLLLDEPSSGLAQAETEDLGPVLVRLVRETGCGMLVIEHDIPLITTISDRMVAMDLGSVVASGTPQEVTSHPKVMASYLAASEDVVSRSDIGKAVGAALGVDVVVASINGADGHVEADEAVKKTRKRSTTNPAAGAKRKKATSGRKGR